ncbi:MAG: ABC transporter ATP-binding protein [Kiritimatiellae bacterium]|nr:ABC transporter ATP-binding protein [Kiritimatiellia bacterium]MDW8459477.1 ABC transporter ATP-binding protein [Verrucomicrobiota bacterium]
MNASLSSEAVIVAVGLHKQFRDFWRRPKVHAVRDVSFEIKSGEVFGLLGPNGSGKSTTIKMILGLLQPTRGVLRVLGRDPRDVRVKARIGYLPEESHLYPYLTAEETLDFYGKLFDLDRSERRRRIEQLLEMIGLQHARHRRVGEFSKGMMRRIGLAQALINDPDLVILDEPTSGLDPIGCRQIKDLILTLAKRGKTVLLSSHLLADVEDVCDRVMILYNGKIQALGPIRELLEVRTQTRILLPMEVDAGTMQRILNYLRAELGAEPGVDHPTRDLEQFFLDVVERARRETTEASGVGASKGVAEYLAAVEPSARGADLLAAMVKPESPASAAAPAGEAQRPAQPDPNRALSKLVKPDGD